MMGEVVNLRLKRKDKARAEAAEKAVENRAAFGRPKSEKELMAARLDKAERALDGHKREE